MRVLNVFLLKVFLVATLLFHYSFAQLVEASSQESIAIENRLTNQIEEYLSGILPTNAFAVSAAVKASRKKVKEFDVEVVDELRRQRESSRRTEFKRQQAEEGIISPQESDLPGLEPEASTFEPGVQSDPKDNPLAYRYVEKLIVEQVNVQITLDNDVAKVTQDAIKRAIGGRLEVLYGNNAVLKVLPVDIVSDLDEKGEGAKAKEDTSKVSVPPFAPEMNKAAEKAVEKTFMERYSVFFYVVLALVGMILGTLLVFSLMLLIFRYLNRRERRKEFEFSKEMNFLDKKEKRDSMIQDHPYYPPPFSHNVGNVKDDARQYDKDTEKKKKDFFLDDKKSAPKDEFLDEKSFNDPPKNEKPIKPHSREELLLLEAKFLDVFLLDVLASREYLLKLSSEEKNELYQSFSTESVKEHFKKIDPSFEENAEIFTDKSPEEISSIQAEALKKSTGGILQFRKLINAQLKDSIGKLSLLKEDEIEAIFSKIPAKSLVNLSRYVDSEIMLSYVRKLGENKRRELLKEMGKREEVSPQELDKIKNFLAQAIKVLEQNIFLDRVEEKKIFETIFSASNDSKKLLEEMRLENKEMYENYKQYAITFEDMLADVDSDVYRRLLNNTPNDEIAVMSLGLPEEDRNRLFLPLSENRRELVESLVFTKDETPKEEVRKTREKILNLYRESKA